MEEDTESLPGEPRILWRDGDGSLAGSLRNQRPSERGRADLPECFGKPAARHRMEPRQGMPRDSVPSDFGRIMCWKNQELGDATRE